MAAGDITRNYPFAIGARMMITGTVELDDTFRDYVFAPTTSVIEHISLTPSDSMGTAEAVPNYNSSDVATNGTAKIRGNDPTVRTFTYAVVYSGF